MKDYVIKYQNANQSLEEVIRNFVVRKKEYEDTIKSIKTAKEGDSFSHLIFVGRRGSGKSTLLRRIQAGIIESDSLKSKYEVVNLGEEQSGVYRFFDLWDYVIRDLNAQGYDIVEPDFRLYKDNLKEYSKELHKLVIQSLRNKGKRLLLLIDNIDRIFDNIGEDVALFRELLMNFKEIRIIGGSTVMSEHFWRYDMPFYEYFTIKRLEPLSLKEIELLLQHWSELKGLPEIKDYLKIYPGKIQSIRMLTDGLPRTMLLFIDMLLDRKEQNGYQYLQSIVDNATPIYQERLGTLSASQRKVITELAFIWDAATVEELVDKCKMESKVISALLSQLVAHRFVEKIKGKTKNFYYRIEERFFNLWLNMTQGGPQQRYEAKALTSFLESWYDKTELEGLVKSFSGQLLEKQVKADFAESLGYALLKSKTIDAGSKHDLVFGLNRYDVKIAKVDLKEVFGDLNKSIRDAFEEKKFEKVIELLNLGDIEEGARYSSLAFAYTFLGNDSDAEKYYLLAIDKKDVTALYNLGVLYNKQGKYELAEKYYLEAVEKGNASALNNLGNLYLNEEKYELAEKYYLEAIDKGNENALYNLGIFYSKQEKYELAEKYYLEAIDEGDNDALYNLGTLYLDQEKYELAEKYYLEAIDKGDNDALYNLGVIYYETQNVYSLQKHLKKNKTDIYGDFLLVFYIYIGEMEFFAELFENYKKQLLSKYTLFNLLVHHQTALVKEYFETHEEARETYKPLYYAVLHVLNDKDVIKMPPEIEENVNDVLKGMKERQEFYYSKIEK